MPILNLDPIQASTIDVTQKLAEGEERVWKLRADVPASVLLDVFDLFALDEGLDQITTAAEMRTRFEARMAMTASICLRIFQHTYPTFTAAELGGMLTYTQQREVIMLFFSLLGVPLSALSGGPSASAPGGPATTSSTPDGSPTMKTTPRTKTRR
jgi:hypothetical protein